MLAFRSFEFPVFIALVLLSSACQPSTVVSTLEAAISAAEIAVPVIGAATHLNPKTSAEIVTYLQEVNIATEQSATILAGPGTSAQKSAQIVQAFAKIAAGCNCVPPGTPQEVVVVVNAVAQAVLNFLTSVKPQGVIASPPHITVTAGDRAALGKLKNRAVQNAAKLKEVKK